MKSQLHHHLTFLAKIGFWVVLVVIPFRYRFQLQDRPVGTIYGDYTDFLLFASDIALIFTLCVWLLDKAIYRQPLKRIPFFVSAPLIALTIVSAMSIITSLDAPLSAYHVIRLILLLGFAYCVTDNVASLRDVAPPVALQIAIQSVVGISQFLEQRDVGLRFAGEYLLRPEWAGVSVVYGEDQRWLRAYGLSDHPNILGGCLAFGLLLILGHILFTPARERDFIYQPVFVIGNIALLTTFSRSAWLGYAAGIVLLMTLLLVQQKREALRDARHLFVRVVIIMLPFVVALTGLLATRLSLKSNADMPPSEQQSLGERTILNDIALRVFAQNPLLGTGIGTSPQAIRQQAPDLATSFQPAHFTLLTAATEIGLFGVTVYALMLAAPWIAFASNANLRHSTIMQTASIALLAVTVVGYFDYYPWLLAPGRMWQYLIWGLWAAFYRSTLTDHHDS